MDITITATDPDEREESVRLIAESAAGVLRGDRARARRLRFGTPPIEPGKWAKLAEQGWLLSRLSEDRGGLGMGLSELCSIARAMGAELTPEPMPMACLIAPALPDDTLEAVLECREIVLPAFACHEGALPVLNAGRLTGTTDPVPLAGVADAFVVQTSTGAALVRASASGLALQTRASHDGGHLGFLSFDGAAATALAVDLAAVREQAALILSAQLLGIAEAAFEITLAYLKDRRQFDRPIGAFQALQHRMVDLYLELALMRAAVEAAATALDDGTTDDAAALAVSLAKARSTKGAQAITQAAIQLHGGIGYTDEADIGLYLRKAMTLAGVLGTEAFHRARALTLSKVTA